MAYTFLHMGCNQPLAQQAVSKTQGVTLLESMHAGLKLQAQNETAQMCYFQNYYWYERLSQEKRLMQQLPDEFETDNPDEDLDYDEGTY